MTKVNLLVVYFNKCMGAAYSKYWSKKNLCFSQFFTRFQCKNDKKLANFFLFPNPGWHKNASLAPYNTSEHTKCKCLLLIIASF